MSSLKGMLLLVCDLLVHLQGVSLAFLPSLGGMLVCKEEKVYQLHRLISAKKKKVVEEEEEEETPLFNSYSFGITLYKIAIS